MVGYIINEKLANVREIRGIQTVLHYQFNQYFVECRICFTFIYFITQ